MVSPRSVSRQKCTFRTSAGHLYDSCGSYAGAAVHYLPLHRPVRYASGPDPAWRVQRAGHLSAPPVFASLSNEYIESAQIDGAGHIRIFLSILFPLVRPAIATYAILRFIWTWNDFQTPLVFLNSKTLYTLQLGMNAFADRNGAFYSLIMAASVSAIVPLLVVFILGQKQVIEGISLGGVKG